MAERLISASVASLHKQIYLIYKIHLAVITCKWLYPVNNFILNNTSSMHWHWFNPGHVRDYSGAAPNTLRDTCRCSTIQ